MQAFVNGSVPRLISAFVKKICGGISRFDWSARAGLARGLWPAFDGLSRRRLPRSRAKTCLTAVACLGPRGGGFSGQAVVSSAPAVTAEGVSPPVVETAGAAGGFTGKMTIFETWVSGFFTLMKMLAAAVRFVRPPGRCSSGG